MSQGTHPDVASTDPLRASGGATSFEALEAGVMLDGLRRRMFKRSKPPRVGRFELRRRLGRGAHGAVYLAHDTQLDRLVAVKLLRSTAADPRDRARLLREAQTLARLNHPNVLSIHDVWFDGDRGIIAMEYAPDGTLHRWCTANLDRGRPRFAEVFGFAIDVGRGLAAAHEAGIIHRDIKPGNILIGEDGRALLGDFGVARTGSGDPPPGPAAPDGSSSSDSTPTRTDAIVGTPGYMAPEQRQGYEDEKSDQWSFCAAFWEAAYGLRPFADDDTRAERAPQAPRRTESVPRWWRSILARGLDPDPSRRWPSIAALVAELEAAEGRRRRRGWRRAGGVVVLSGISAAGWLYHSRTERASACESAAASISEVYAEPVGSALRGALVETGLPFAEQSAARTTAAFERYADGWRSQYAAGCRAAEADRTRTEASWAATRACLADRRVELEALVGTLTDAPDRAAVELAVDAASALTPVERCNDEVWLTRMGTGPRSDDGDVRERLWQARAQLATGGYARGRGLVSSLIDEVADHADAHLRGEVLQTAGELAARDGSHARAREHFEAGFALAVAASEDELALGFATSLVSVSQTLADFDKAKWWVDMAEGFATRLGHVDDLPAAQLAVARGILLRDQWRHADSQRELEAAAAIQTRILGPESPVVASTMALLANAYSRQDRHDEAEQTMRRVIDLETRIFGPDHPAVALSRADLGIVYRTALRFEEAALAHAQALDITRRAYPPDHIRVANALVNLAEVYPRLGRTAEAEPLLLEALSIIERELGPEHPRAAIVHAILGQVYVTTDRAQKAEEAFARALAIREAAEVPNRMEIADTLMGLSLAQHRSGRTEQAIVSGERALEAMRASQARPVDLARVQFVLAQAIWDAGADRRRAVALATEAQSGYRSGGEIGERGLGLVTGWLEEIGAAPRPSGPHEGSP